MSTDRRLLFHIGTHKTGTSSFQRSMIVNRDALKAGGVHPLLDRDYRDGAYIPKRLGQHRTLGHLLVRPDLKTGARLMGTTPTFAPQQRRLRLDRLAARIRDLSEPAVLISAEQFCLMRTDTEKADLGDFIAATGRRAETVCAFRDLEEWRASWFAQAARWTYEGMEETPNLPPEQQMTAEWYFDTDAIRDFWRDFNLTEVAFDKSVDMVARIYRAFGIDPSPLETGQRANVRGKHPDPR